MAFEEIQKPESVEPLDEEVVLEKPVAEAYIGDSETAQQQD